MQDKNGNFNSALLGCVRYGSIEELQSLLQNDNSNLTDREGKTLLHYAAASNNVSVTQHFIDDNYDVDRADYHGNTPFMLAVKGYGYHTAKLLIEAGANMYLGNNDAESIISNRAHYKPEDWIEFDEHEEFVMAILRQFKKDCCNDEQLLLTRLRDFGCSLFQVISLRDANVTRLMLENGLSIDELDRKGNRTLLHEAVRLGDFENVKILVEFGASVDALDDESIPPLYRLFDEPSDTEEDDENKLKILKLLIDHGALNFQPTDDFITTPLQYILTEGTLGAINLSMQYDVDYNSGDALYWLVRNFNDDVLEALRGKSSDLNVHEANEIWPLLGDAVFMGSLRKTQFLLERGANPNVADAYGEPPLIIAIADFDVDNPGNLTVNRLSIVRLLLQYGADAQYSHGHEQETVFDQAKNTGEVLKSIIAHLALIESCGVTISDLIRQKINSRNTRKKHFEDCKKQIEKMKETTINGSVTLYKLLTEIHLKITRYARNPEFASKFEEAMKVHQFLDQYYLVSLHNRVEKAIQEAKLKEDAIVVLNKIFLYRMRNCTEIFDQILDYLTCDDIKNICKVYDLY